VEAVAVLVAGKVVAVSFPSGFAAAAGDLTSVFVGSEASGDLTVVFVGSLDDLPSCPDLLNMEKAKVARNKIRNLSHHKSKRYHSQ